MAGLEQFIRATGWPAPPDGGGSPRSSHGLLSLSRPELYSSAAGLTMEFMWQLQGVSSQEQAGMDMDCLPPTFDGLRLHICLGRFQDFTSLDERFIYGEDICLGVLKKLYQQDFIKSTKQGFLKPTK